MCRSDDLSIQSGRMVRKGECPGGDIGGNGKRDKRSKRGTKGERRANDDIRCNRIYCKAHLPFRWDRALWISGMKVC